MLHLGLETISDVNKRSTIKPSIAPFRIGISCTSVHEAVPFREVIAQ
jgi:hypothetical protein